MDFLKSIGVYCIIILFIASLYNDLLKEDVSLTASEQNISDISINVLKIKVQHGDTVLSIVEDNSIVPLNVSIKRITEDFNYANPNVNPRQIKADHYYYFPVYK